MRPRLRAALAFGAAAAIMLMLDVASTRRRGWRAARRLVGLLRPRPVPDETVEARVMAKLERVATHPESIHAQTEHGCVVLTGEVDTDERARIVREVAHARGVDSVVDVMTERRGPRRPSPWRQAF